jgi:hypothetical protein
VSDRSWSRADHPWPTIGANRSTGPGSQRARGVLTAQTWNHGEPCVPRERRGATRCNRAQRRRRRRRGSSRRRARRTPASIEGAPVTPRCFERPLALIAGLGFVVRVAYVAFVMPHVQRYRLPADPVVAVLALSRSYKRRCGGGVAGVPQTRLGTPGVCHDAAMQPRLFPPLELAVHLGKRLDPVGNGW